MTSVSALEKVHIKGLFGDYEYKSENNLSAAIPPLIVATLIAVLVSYIIERKIPYMPLVGGIIISIFGGLTLYFNNPVFLYIKPTIINVIFAIVLFVVFNILIRFRK